MVGETMHTKVTGVTFENRQDIIKDIKKDDDLQFEREPSNPFDANAVKVMWKDKCIGYISRDFAKDITLRLKQGYEYEIKVSEITGGTKDKPTRGVNILMTVTKEGDSTKKE